MTERTFTRMELRSLYILKAFRSNERGLPRRVLTLILTFLSGERVGGMETGNLVSKLIERGLAVLDKDGVHLTEAGSAAMALLEKDLSQLDKDRIDGGARKFLSEIIN
jgi:hypothetical protein